MKCNARGINLIQSMESCRLTVYLDTGGLATVGWGQRVDPAKYPVGSTITQEQADAWFFDHLDEVEETLDRLISYELGENECSALCSFVYNIGAGNFAKSAVLHDVNSGDHDNVPAHMKAWCRDHKGHVLDGLSRRRDLEIELWNRPDDPEEPPLFAA